MRFDISVELGADLLPYPVRLRQGALIQGMALTFKQKLESRDWGDRLYVESATNFRLLPCFGEAMAR